MVEEDLEQSGQTHDHQVDVIAPPPTRTRVDKPQRCPSVNKMPSEKGKLSIQSLTNVRPETGGQDTRDDTESDTEKFVPVGTNLSDGQAIACVNPARETQQDVRTDENIHALGCAGNDAANHAD